MLKQHFNNKSLTFFASVSNLKTLENPTKLFFNLEKKEMKKDILFFSMFLQLCSNDLKAQHNLQTVNNLF